jgi:hypothetical protein
VQYSSSSSSSSSTEIERLWKTQVEKGKCKWREKVVAEATKVKTNVSIGMDSEGDQDSK